MFVSSGSTEREIDEYQDEFLGCSGSYESSSESSDNISQQMQCKTTSRTKASSSRRSKSPSPPQDEEEDENVIYSCVPKVASTLGANKLTTLVGRYQIPHEFRPLLLESGEWCCSPLFGFGVYASYLLAGLRFPLNSFCRGLFHRLGIGPNQLNPNG